MNVPGHEKIIKPTETGETPSVGAETLSRPEVHQKTEIRFFKGKTDYIENHRDVSYEDVCEKVSENITEIMGARSLGFLLGSGCSSYCRDKIELGVPTMRPLANEFIPEKPDAKKSDKVLDQSDIEFFKLIGIDLLDEAAGYRQNLEKLMEVSHAYRFVLSKRANEPTRTETHEDPYTKLQNIINKTQAFLLDKCTNCVGVDSVLDLYKSFYRRLVYRDRSLPRPWIFTTNYDLFSESALDALGIVYCNGFSGFVNRKFSPSSFRYAIAEQLDISGRKWTAVDNYLYLCKLHGSVNWTSDDKAGIYEIIEKQSPVSSGDVMIYPTPLKHHATLASPYTELLHEFQGQIVQEQTVLVCIGYSFSDEHINNIILQALTVPTFRLIIFGNPEEANLKRLIDLDDPRIWIIGGEAEPGKPSHYFEHIVRKFLPELPSERVDTSVNKVIDLLRKGFSEEGRKGRKPNANNGECE